MKKRVILFDDNDTIRALLKTVFERRGYEVLAFSDPDESPLLHAHACRCESGQVCADIVVSDIDMPKVSGLQFLESQMKKGCKIRNVAVMSGDWSDDRIAHAEALGCMIFRKPFNLKDLNDWIDRCEKNISHNRLLSNWFLDEKAREITE